MLEGSCRNEDGEEKKWENRSQKWERNIEIKIEKWGGNDKMTGKDGRL